MTTETVGEKTVIPDVIPSTEVVGLKEQLAEAHEKINKYDGERKDYSEQTNLIANLKTQVESLQQTVQQTEDEDTKHLNVTQEELRSFKAGEQDRFAEFNKTISDKATADQTLYQKYLGEESLAVKDETIFDEICKEHDYLVANNAMPSSTGDLKADAKIAWREAENSLYRKKLQTGGKVDFKEVKDVGKPVIPGQQELSSSTGTTQTTTMPTNLPDDAKEFIAMMGDQNSPDKINKALGR